MKFPSLEFVDQFPISTVAISCFSDFPFVASGRTLVFNNTCPSVALLMFKTPVIVPNTSIPQRIGSKNKRTLRTSCPTPLLPNPPTTHVPSKNHTHPADLPLTPCADTYFTNSPSRPNMQPLNPPLPRWATRSASARYPARQRVCHRSNTQGSSVSGQEQAQRREPPFSQRCEYSLGGAQLRGYPPSTPKNDHSAGRAYPRDLRARILQASDHRHPPGASPTHVPPARASSPARALSSPAIFPRFMPKAL